jgi:hypothetical protein
MAQEARLKIYPRGVVWRATLDHRIESSIGYELRTDVYMETQLYAERCYKPCSYGTRSPLKYTRESFDLLVRTYAYSKP